MCLSRQKRVRWRQIRDKIKESGFEYFWQKNWKNNMMPEIFNQAIKDFTREAYDRGFNDALSEPHDVREYLATGSYQ